MIDELLTFTFIVSTVTFTAWWIIALLPDRKAKGGLYPPVTVVMPAHDEESCIKSTVESVLAAEYPGAVEVVVVNDGSTDRTGRIVSGIASGDRRVKLVETDHVGKALAVNRGVEEAQGELIVMLDADSRLEKDALMRFADTFSDPTVGAASGIIRVEVNRNPLTWCQEIEYIYSSMWRYIFNKIGCTYILPGFAAFRKTALRAVGCFSTDTLSEDCDVGLKLRKAGWHLEMSPAVMYTNVPQTLSGVAKQRIRWGRGTVQVLRKHRDMILNPRYGLIGMYGLPNNIYFFIQGIIILPINLYEILNGYMIYFVKYGNYVTFDALAFFFNWISAIGAVQYIYNVLTGVWARPENFGWFLASYVITQSYALLAARKITGLNLRVLFVLCFFFPYYLFTMLFFVIPLLLELNPLTAMKGHINIWEKNR
jgi:cellulose synthase/poly-beta-1,6-N-acetylglucosamine synthase-like glycosyltransferase